MSQIIIWLAGPPQGKGRHRSAVRRNGDKVFVHQYSDATTAKYETQLRIVGTQEMDGKPPLDGPLRVRITALFPVPESWSKRKREQALDGKVHPTVKPDWDNIGKLCDGLNQVCWKDDKQIVEGTVRKQYSLVPGLLIVITLIEVANA